MSANTELSVTLSPALYEHLLAESRRLGVELEWLVASLVFDTQEPVPARRHEGHAAPRPHARRTTTGPAVRRRSATCDA